MSLEIKPVNVRLENITKHFGNVLAADNVNLEIKRGEFFTILGPSGCGKTTTLRIIAGFEVPESGHVYFDNEDVTFKKPYERETTMVFQNYALWPHMTVFDNVAYGLRVKKRKMKIGEEEIERMVKEALEMVRLEGLEKRYPLQLSGGQQQRVALARALVVKPRVLLLDEPLSNLDAKLRIEMREELKRIQSKLGITTVYVTHDQVEALSMSERIAIMDKGKVVQVGTPSEVYFRPKSLFVAEFLGRSNIFQGEVVGKEAERLIVYLPELGMEVKATPTSEAIGGKVFVVIRPEILTLSSTTVKAEDVVYFRGILEFKMFLGDKIEARVKVGSTSLLVHLPNYLDISVGSEIELVGLSSNIIALQR